MLTSSGGRRIKYATLLYLQRIRNVELAVLVSIIQRPTRLRNSEKGAIKSNNELCVWRDEIKLESGSNKSSSILYNRLKLICMTVLSFAYSLKRARGFASSRAIRRRRLKLQCDALFSLFDINLGLLS